MRTYGATLTLLLYVQLITEAFLIVDACLIVESNRQDECRLTWRVGS
jgi:hypothetical protein